MEIDPQPAQPTSAEETREREPASSPRRATVVRYGAMSWIGEFACRPGVLTRPGSHVVVQTDRGIELGEQVDLCSPVHPLCVNREQMCQYVTASGQDFCRMEAGRVLREATTQDVDEHRRLNAHVRDDLDQCNAAADEFNLDMKVVTAEHLLGGERIVFYFRSEGRVDFRDLVKELAHRYRTRIEMRQVGARDEARLVADWEVCGRECCCKGFLKSLRPVNMKMAKLQKSTLDPAKVSGRCGRLRCCLRYESEGYQELAAKLPRRGSRVRAAAGEGTVIDAHVLLQLVMVRCDDDKEFTVPLEEITAFDLPRPILPPLPRPADRDESRPAEPPGAPRDRRRTGAPRREAPERRPVEREVPTAPSQEFQAPPTPLAEAPSDEVPPLGGEATEPTSSSEEAPRRRSRRRRRGRRKSTDGPPSTSGE